MTQKSKKQKDAEAMAQKAKMILEHSRNSVSSFREAFDQLRSTRGATHGGSTTHGEQDLLRAMLVFAGAGLDSSLKQIIRDSFRTLARNDDKIRKKIEVFIEKRLRSKDSIDEIEYHKNMLSKILLSEDPRDFIIEYYIDHLTGSSLQSTQQLLSIVAALNINSDMIRDNKNDLDKLFDVRNKIIHELDVKFKARPREKKRYFRRMNEMRAWTELLLNLSDELIIAIETKLVT